MYKVSIIVPFYNAEKYIFDIVASLEQQTYKNTEIIFVNNGSTDNSKELLIKRIKDNNMICIDEPRKGVNLARLKGVEVSTGDYIYFCDIDDKLEPNAIEVLLMPVYGFNSDYVMANFYREKENGKARYLVEPNKFIETFDNSKDYFLKDSISTLWNKLIKKDLLEPEMFINSKICEDMVISECSYMNAKNPRKINVPIYHYIRHKESAITNNDIDSYYDIIRNLERLKLFYEKNNYDNQDKERLMFIYVRSIYGQIARLLLLKDTTKQLKIYCDLKNYLETLDYSKDIVNKKGMVLLTKKFLDRELLFYLYILMMPQSVEKLRYLLNQLKQIFNPFDFYNLNIISKREILFYEIQKELRKK